MNGLRELISLRGILLFDESISAFISAYFLDLFQEFNALRVEPIEENVVDQEIFIADELSVFSTKNLQHAHQARNSTWNIRLSFLEILSNCTRNELYLRK